EIFRRVAERSTSTRNIRRTCRYWRDAAEADPALPRKIALRQNAYYAKCQHLYDQEWSYCVHDQNELFSALGRIRNAHFHFHLEINRPPELENWENLPWDLFERQCSGFFIETIRSDLRRFVTDILKKVPPLRNIQQFSSSQTDMMLSLIQPIPSVKFTLRTLTWMPERTPTFDLEQFGYIFQNLTSFTLCYYLHIPSDFVIKLFSSFQRLEEFTWSVNSHLGTDGAFIRSRVDWKVKLRSLSVPLNLLSAFPSSLLSELAILTCNPELGIHPTDLSAAPWYHLPRLAHLSARDNWRCLVKVDAPELRHLSLMGSLGDHAYLKRTKLNPTSMEIYDDGGGSVLSVFLAQKSFTNLVELSIKVEVRWADKANRLIHLIVAHADNLSSSFPQLKTIDFYLRHKPGDPEETRVVEKTKRALLSIFGNHPYLVSIW
ncbi:hypothetical protein FRC17_007871, partial [Serendipita sp. 399]